jgi:protocatechuate 3,4-dioxygenase beta subunit
VAGSFSALWLTIGSATISLAHQSENAEMRNKVAPKAAAVVAVGPGLTVRTSAGPYYITNTPRLVGGDLNPTGLPGDPIKIVGHVYSGTDTSKPIAEARIEIWQADGGGVYHPAASGDMSQHDASEIALRGYVLTDPNGAYEFTTIYPGHYSGRTRHIHVRASAAGYGGVTTQIIVPPKAGDGTTPQNDMITSYLPPANLVTFSDQNGVQSGTFDFYLAVD